MYATLTELHFKSPGDRARAVAALDGLLSEARALPGFQALYVVGVAGTQATMVTLYASEEEAAASSAQLRPRLGKVLGQHVTGPPTRVAGAVLLAS